ncbi:hypothetical protein BAUCODRAFT_28952 [Baudoinia panamericana UAMH 10762]|uniref:Uncharacterized protein n=1 Tax=Baudoinia panamericana (strain UAMH 10762) TaxID=717646 RepID=M2N8Y1_BAUPA|nr:uncharacterized protein BAUCODRAFT_28952 [Baudoinia panamericana UAMH 10762]EMD00609.1 hypothetical protein BAUCODRAFT_28952 [Baudoinia panamericana UAMH 10762]
MSPPPNRYLVDTAPQQQPGLPQGSVDLVQCTDWGAARKDAGVECLNRRHRRHPR